MEMIKDIFLIVCTTVGCTATILLFVGLQLAFPIGLVLLVLWVLGVI